MPAQYLCDGPSCNSVGAIERGSDNAKPMGWTEFHQWKGEECIGEWVLCQSCTQNILSKLTTKKDDGP